MESFRKIEKDTFQIDLCNLITGKSATIVATARGNLLDSIAPHLSTAAAVAISHGGKKSRSVHAAFSRCVLVRPTLERRSYRLEIDLRWSLGFSVVEEPSVKMTLVKHDLKLLRRYFPDAVSTDDTPWTLADFYDSVHVPPLLMSVSPRIAQSLSNTSLYPFQQRAVDWLLRRESVVFNNSGVLVPCTKGRDSAFFKHTRDATGRECYVSQVRGMVIPDLAEANADALQSLQGGILAEEMGLGKTVELIALIVQHRRTITDAEVFDTFTGTKVRPSSATLIITPPSILEQWVSEINTHAPELKVLHYKGLPPQSAPAREHQAVAVDNILQYDIVVTTYNVLSKEIHHATPPPDRSLRKAQKHKRRKSPLVEISWWRVCLDEAQMIESGVSQAARVARVIPRCNAWAVSGTPLRKDIQDLRGLLIFLRCDAFANNKAVWDHLSKDSFRAIFGQIALRHTKDKIRRELSLPPQKRVVITVPFTTIEEQNYSDLFRQMCNACWLTPDGYPVGPDRDASHPEVIERMREWLVRLRQTCLHAHVGRKNRKALGAKHGVIRTIHEVLEIMIDQNDTNWKSEAREMILSQIKLGHIKAYAGDVTNRAQTALPYFETALEGAQSYVKMCREELTTEYQKMGKLPSTSEVPLPAEELNSDTEDEKDGDNLGRLPVVRKSLRSFLELEHACKFFIATTYHQIKSNEQLTEPESDDFHRLDKLETEWYQKAKLVRRELLKETKKRAQSRMNRIESKKPFHHVSEIEIPDDYGGIESRKLIDDLYNISLYLNEQAKQIHEWRMNIVNILLMRLIDDDDDQDLTGEEYNDSLKAQDELYVYIMALRTLVADRNSAVHGQPDVLVEHEFQAAEKLAFQKDTAGQEANRGHAPELMIKIAETRRKLQARLHGESLKGIVSGLRSLLYLLQPKAEGGDSRAQVELTMVQKYFSKVPDFFAQQTKTVTELEKEQEMFRTTMNQRLEYYRQFQHISDTVAEYKEKPDEKFDEIEFNKCTAVFQHKETSVAKLKTNHAYLINLRAENQGNAEVECIICRDSIEIGVITKCGHKFCKDCIHQWWTDHKICPLCKQNLRSSDFKDIHFKPNEINTREENHEPKESSEGPTPATTSASIYSDMNDSTMKEIKMIDLDGSYGTKIDMIARHLLWIRANDPGAKSIIFSQFGDFLEVLRGALRRWHIGVSSIMDKDGIRKFKTDPAIDCFLLDAKSNASGLNLVNATYVFLCEPLINPAIELQAIARVHRIGQQRATTVFMYLVRDTVEEVIYDISVARRLEHMKTSSSTSNPGTATPMLQEATLDKANSAELEAAPLNILLRKKGNGEEVKESDLWHCLFGRKKKVADPVLNGEVDRHLRAHAAESRELEMREGRV